MLVALALGSSGLGHVFFAQSLSGLAAGLEVRNLVPFLLLAIALHELLLPGIMYHDSLY